MIKKLGITIGVVLLAGLALWQIRGADQKQNQKDLILHVTDTSKIYHIDILDRSGNLVKLDRGSKGWTVNGDPARTHAVNNLLATVHNQRVSALIPSSALDNVVRDLGSNGVRFDLKRKNGESILTYYVGGVTPDERGTFMIREGSEWPVIVNIPGFVGSLRSRYIMSELDWKSRRIFQPIHTIQSLLLEYPTQQEHSFELKKSTEGYLVAPLHLPDGEEAQVHPYILSVYQELLNDLAAEAVLPDDKRTVLDSAIPFCRLTVTDDKGKGQKLEFYPVDWIDYQMESARPEQVERYYTDANDETIFLTQHLLMQKVFVGYEHFVSLKDFGKVHKVQ